MRWFTSDNHFGHTRIVELAHRPFDDVESMNRAMVDAWNKVVAPDDTVWVLGDVAMGKIRDSLELIGELNGTKYLVKGNHDRGFEGREDMGDSKTWDQKYIEAGFAAVMNGSLGMSFDGQQDKLHVVTMNHFPFTGAHEAVDRYQEQRPEDLGQWLLHGHTHGMWRQKGRQIDVGVDAWGGVPVSEDEIVALIEAGENELEPLDWVA